MISRPGQELADDLALQLQATLEGFLAKIRSLRDGEKELKPLVDAVRDWLVKHPGEELYDERTDLVGYLKPGGTSMVYDPPKAIETRNAGLHGRLVELGCIYPVLDAKKVEECIKGGLLLTSDIAPFRHPKENTPRVEVEKR